MHVLTVYIISIALILITIILIILILVNTNITPMYIHLPYLAPPTGWLAGCILLTSH